MPTMASISGLRRMAITVAVSLAVTPTDAFSQELMAGSVYDVPTPLPPVDPDPPDAVKLASYPRDFTEPLLDQPGNPVLLPDEALPKQPPHRSGFFQRIAITTTYLPRM